MGWKISSKSQILFLSSIGVCRTIMEFYSYPMTDTLEQVWEMELPERLSTHQSLIKSVISGILLIRGFTGHLYIATYFLILYPILMGKLRSLLLIWMFFSGLRSIVLNIAITGLGFLVCSTMEELNTPCFEFAVGKAFDLGCSIYMWSVVNNFYHSLKRASLGRSHIQSPLSSPVSSFQFVDETSSSMLSEEWSLPASLVEEFHRSTKENLHEGSPDSASNPSRNFTARSVDSILAQAMVDWFIKKVFKFKPKNEYNTGKSASLTNLKPRELAALQCRIKKSIADIKEDDIFDLLTSEENIKKTVNDVSINNKTTEMKKMHDSRERKKKKQEDTIISEEIVEHIIKPEISDDILRTTPGGATCRRPYGRDNSHNSSTELFHANKKLKEDVNLINYIISTDGNKDSFDIQNISNINFKINPLSFEPSKAISLVKHLFNENIDESIQQTINRKIRQTELDDEFEIDFDIWDTYSSEKRDRENTLEINDKALDSSYVVVKSIVDDVVGGAVVEHRKGILKKNIGLENKDGSTRCEACILLNSLKESKTKSSALKNTGTSKKLTFLDDRIISLTSEGHKSGMNAECKRHGSKLPSVVNNVLKDINIDLTSKNSDVNDLKTLYDKENYDKQNLLKRKFDDNLNKSVSQIKSLRYHYRRVNPIKVPIKRTKNTSLTQKSLISILEDLKSKEVKLLDSFQTEAKTGINTNEIHKKIINDFKNVNITKHSSAQTITTKKLLEKIKEIEEH